MHARRSIYAGMKNRLKEHATKFTLTNETRRLRLPIHGVVLVTLTILTGLAYYYIRQYDAVIQQMLNFVFDPKFSPKIDMPAALLYPPLIKVSLLSLAIVGIVTWYIRWMNLWFDRHAQAEFELKQFELDVDRASWVVETAMEWRSSQHGVIPSRLLDSISKNLFVSKEQIRDENIHPADYLASAILGSAAKAKLKVGDNEIELDRKGIKQMEKDT